MDTQEDFDTNLMNTTFSILNATSNTKRHICSCIALFKVGEYACTNSNTSLSISYILVHIEIFVDEWHSVDKYMEELSSFDNKYIIIGAKEFLINMDSRDYGQIEFGSIVTTRDYRDADTNESLYFLSPSRVTHPQTCLYSIRHMRITQMSYCPRVLLTSEEYQTRDNKNQICFMEIDLCLYSGLYEATENGYKICSDTYFMKTENMTRTIFASSNCTVDPTTTLDDFYLVSIVCASVSMFFLLLTILTYSLFKSLRTTPGKNNMFLSINLLIAQGLFQFGIGQTSLGYICTVLGVLIHYFWLSSIVWMNVCSIHMFRVFSSLKARTIATQRDERNVVIKYIVYSIMAPLFPISVNILVSLVTSDWTDIGYGGCMCYISSANMILYTFAIPVGVLILFNIVLFILVVMVIRRSQNANLSSNQDRMSIMVYLKLSCLTGSSWILGFLYNWLKYEVVGYAFIILTASEGLFIFLSFICSKRVLQLYSNVLDCFDLKSKQTVYLSRTTTSTYM